MTAPYGVRHALFPAVLVILSAGVTAPLLAEDAPSLNQSEWDLRTYSMCAADVRPVADLVMSIAGRGNVVLMPDTREVVVFAPPSVQDQVGTGIAALEETVLLFQSVDADPFDARELAVSLNVALAGGVISLESESAPRIVPDAAVGKVYVWAKQPQLTVILDMTAKWKDGRKVAGKPVPERRTDDVAGSFERCGPPRRKAKAGTDDRDALASNDHDRRNDSRDAAGNRSRPRPAPVGPVQIEHLEGSDLLLLRERGGGQPGKARLPAPVGPVQIEHLEGTDLLLLRGR